MAVAGGVAGGGAAELPPDAVIGFDGILRRQVPLEWFECVALVAELCAVLAAGEHQYVPSLDRISLNAEGVTVRGGGGAGDGAELARLLNSLLSTASPPAPLRLFVLHAASSDAHKSIKHFGGALAYYERPNRPELVRAAWERCLATPEPVMEDTPPDAPEPEEPAPTPDLPAPRGAGRRLVVAAIVVFACAASVGVLAARWHSSANRSGEGGALDRAFGRLVDGAAGMAGAVAAVLSSDAAPRPLDETTADTGRAGAPSPVRITRAVRVDPIAEPATAEGAPGVTDTSAGEPAPVTTPEAAAGEEVDSVGASDVRPPVLLDPTRVPAPPPSRGSARTVIELLVNERGLVDRVRVVEPSERITDMMLLSAAKTWMYQPARKDGRPVPYLLTFEWVTPTR